MKEAEKMTYDDSMVIAEGWMIYYCGPKYTPGYMEDMTFFDSEAHCRKVAEDSCRGDEWYVARKVKIIEDVAPARGASGNMVR